MTSGLTSGAGWGDREQAIPGEWAALVLIMVLCAALGLVVLWFTVLRHERTVRSRAARRPPSARAGGPSEGVLAMAGIGVAADERVTQTAEADAPAETEETAEVADGVEASESTPDSDAGNSSEDAPAAAEDDHVDHVDHVEDAEDVEDVEDVGAVADVDEAGEARGTEARGQSAQSPATGQRKLTDEILSRVESELARREAPRWKELATLVQEEFGVAVHPSSIQKAVKRRRQAAARQSAQSAQNAQATQRQDTQRSQHGRSEPARA